MIADVPKFEANSRDFVSNFGYQISQHRCYEREMDGLTEAVAF